jgi:hypothetical protein
MEGAATLLKRLRQAISAVCACTGAVDAGDDGAGTAAASPAPRLAAGDVDALRAATTAFCATVNELTQTEAQALWGACCELWVSAVRGRLRLSRPVGPRLLPYTRGVGMERAHLIYLLACALTRSAPPELVRRNRKRTHAAGRLDTGGGGRGRQDRSARRRHC